MKSDIFLKTIKPIIGSNLRNRFILFFIVLATVPVLVLGGVSLYLIDLSHRRDVSNLELQLIGQKTEEIEKFFADTLGILELRVGFTQKSEIELSQQYFLLEGLLEENRAFEEVSFISLEGKERAKKVRAEGETELLDVSFLPKFRMASRGENFIGDVYYTLSGPFITLASPVRNRNGDIIQILSAEVNLSVVTRSVENALLGTSGYLALFDQGGSLISRGNGGNVDIGINLSGVSRIDRVLSGEILDGLGERDRYKSLFGEVSVVGAGKPVGGTGWALFAEWPLADADALIQDIRNQIMQLTLLAIFAVLLLAPLFANRLIRPIKVLQRGARAIKEGKFEKRVEIKTGDELEELGEEFNRMAKGLKRLQELKDEFVFVAAHELRAPVTVIKGYLSMISEGDAGSVSPKMSDFLSQVNKANQNLVKLVEDLLQVARSEAGRIEIAVKPLDIVLAVKGVLGELKTLADEKSIKMVYKPQPDLPQVLADPDKLREVIVNLVNNAIRYTLGAGTITVSHEVKNKMLITYVEDTGIGISKENQKKLFTKFYRIKKEGTEGISGTGLGLWIVKQLVLKMKGEIWVVSTEGKGSTFSFSLPITNKKLQV